MTNFHRLRKGLGANSGRKKNDIAKNISVAKDFESVSDFVKDRKRSASAATHPRTYTKLLAQPRVYTERKTIFHE